MPRRVVVVLAVVALLGCGPAARGGSSGGGQSSGAAAAIDLTFSGEISGHATQLAKKGDCTTDPKYAVQFHLYGFTLYPVVGGKTYKLGLSIGNFPGPGTLPGNKVLLVVEDEQAKKGWYTTDASTGTFVVNPDVISGSIDIPDIAYASYPKTKVGVKGTYRCPPT